MVQIERAGYQILGNRGANNIGEHVAIRPVIEILYRAFEAITKVSHVRYLMLVRLQALAFLLHNPAPLSAFRHTGA